MQLEPMIITKALQDKLISNFEDYGVGISVIFADRTHTEAAGISGLSIHDKAEVGCVIKGITATLVAFAILEHKISLDSSIHPFFRDVKLNGVYVEHLQRTTIGHLLNHTCGLDDTVLDQSEAHHNAPVHADKLLQNLQLTNPIAPPGKIYKNSNIGYFLLASILENLYQMKFGAILRQKILMPLNINSDVSTEPSFICPAMGTNLQLSAADLIKIIELNVTGDVDLKGLRGVCDEMRTGPYCHAVTTGLFTNIKSGPGWMDFGGTYGYNSLGTSGSATVRFSPTTGVAMVANSRHPKLAYTVLLTLFNELMPETKTSKTLKHLNRSSWSEMRTDTYTGIYENYRFRIFIDDTGEGVLRARVVSKAAVHELNDDAPYVERNLKAFEDHLFLAADHAIGGLSWLQFTDRTSNDKFQYIHTDKHIFSRVDAAVNGKRNSPSTSCAV